MNELREMVRAVDASDGQFVLATVVDVVGSAYRRPAARMLIFPDGTHIGGISGGCLERDLCQAAASLTESGPKLISFDTRRDATNLNPRYNLGCNGVVYVLVERITRDEKCPASMLRYAFETGEVCVVATVYQTDSREGSRVGTRFSTMRELPAQAQTQKLADIWGQVRESGRPVCCELLTAAGSTRLLIERITPAKPLWIFGAGDDARPLAEMARQLGWEVSVIDHRASLLTPDRFPRVRRIHSAWHNALRTLHATPETAAVLMTHSFEADTLLLPQLAESCVRYLGVLGPKSRTGRVLLDLHSRDEFPSTDLAERLHTPSGLDIGAATPAEIAVSVLGEIIAIDSGREGGLLGNRQGPIHEPVQRAVIELKSEIAPLRESCQAGTLR